MSKLYIADSEDEDDADSSPLSPPPAILPHLANGQSSDPLSRGTDSTDTVFFRSIYHEQAEAAQERVRSVSKDVSAVKGTRASRENELWDVPSSPNPQLTSSRRKRRKLGNDDEDISPQTRNHDEGMASSMLPPTLQIDDEAAFVITPRTMTKSQQQGYVSVDHASSLGQDAGLASHGTAQRKLELALSSSGTNVNTPRTLDALTQASNAQEADLPTVINDAEDLPSSQPTMAAPPRRRRMSSPDVITIAEASGYQEDHYEPVEEDELAQHGSAVPKDNGMEEYEEPAFIEDEDSPFDEEPVKPKKKRGRPKKAKAEAVVHEAEPPAEPAEKVKPGKKKRGRPRKEQATPRKAVDVEEHSSPKIEEGGQDADTNAVSAAGPDAAQDRITTTGAQSNEKIKANVQNGMDEEEKSQLKAPNEADSNVQVEKAPKVERIKAPEAGLKDDGKPVYRVGLSKRSRIAPLLKIIKK